MVLFLRINIDELNQYEIRKWNYCNTGGCYLL